MAAKPAGAGKPAAAAPAPGAGSSQGAARPRALVTRARRSDLLSDKGIPRPERLDEALGAAVARAAGEKGPVEGMRKLFKPGDVVGIKLNTLGGKGLSPTPQVVDALTRWLQAAGVPARNILVVDRSDRELTRAGFTLNRGESGVRCFGINDDWEWTPREWGRGGSCFARVLVKDITALINVGVLKDHDLAGVSVCLKNWYGFIHNPNKHHDDGCNPYVAHLAAYPLIHDKVRLGLVDGMTAQCHGGPARQPRWAWPWQGFLASADLVAIDAVGKSIIEARRKEVGLPTLAQEKREPRYIVEGGQIGLGESDMSRIRIEDV